MKQIIVEIIHCIDIIWVSLQEFDKTSRGKHEGGDAAWEESKLQSYKKSELRLTEIQENWCKKSKHSDQCHSLAEKVEHLIEDWWFHQQDEHEGR